MPSDTRNCFTALARRSPRPRLYSVEPRSSQWPSMVTLNRGYFFRKSAVVESAARASGRISALSKSKYASRTSLKKSSSSVGPAGGGGGGGGAFTETVAAAVVEPPGPEAVMVYVVESDGVTLVEPCAVTAPTSGAIESSVASVEFQLKFEDSPLLMEVGLACNVTVGRAAAGAGAGGAGGGATGFLAQPKVKAAAASAAIRPVR